MSDKPVTRIYPPNEDGWRVVLYDGWKSLAVRTEPNGETTVWCGAGMFRSRGLAAALKIVRQLTTDTERRRMDPMALVSAILGPVEEVPPDGDAP